MESGDEDDELTELGFWAKLAYSISELFTYAGDGIKEPKEDILFCVSFFFQM